MLRADKIEAPVTPVDKKDDQVPALERSLLVGVVSQVRSEPLLGLSLRHALSLGVLVAWSPPYLESGWEK